MDTLIEDMPLLKAVSLKATALSVSPLALRLRMKKVFVCSQGLEKRFCQIVASKGHLPINGHLFLSSYLSDIRASSYSLNVSLELLGLCDELWVFVDHADPSLSESMKQEISEAAKLKKRIKFFYHHYSQEAKDE